MGVPRHARVPHRHLAIATCRNIRSSGSDATLAPGDWNWYLPSWLNWLPKLEHSEPSQAPQIPAVAATS